MSILTPTKIVGTVVWLGRVPQDAPTIRAVPEPSLTLDWGGPVGDRHHGLTRPACVRVRRQYPRGTEIRNIRQLSILSEEEMAAIAADLGLPRLAPEWLGATVVLRGIPDLTLLPPASRLIAEEGVALVTDTENAPCRFPADQIEIEHPGHGRAFPKVAEHRRGLTAAVERPGTLSLGQTLQLHLPPQRLWRHA
jgi:hypothetical protein